MSFLDTSHKRKSAVMTSIIAVIMLLLMFLFGLTYFDPPKEYGIAVNFGTTDFGSGNKQPTEALKPAAEAASEIEPEEQAVEEVQEEVVEAAAEPQAAPEEVAEEVITQNNDEAIAIKKREEERKREIEEAEKEAKREADAQRKAEAERKAAAERRLLPRERPKPNDRLKLSVKVKNKKLKGKMQMPSWVVLATVTAKQKEGKEMTIRPEIKEK